MPARRSDDEINELLKLAGVSTRDPEARAWVEGALVASRALAAQEPRPSPAKHNAPLNAIERAADRLITALIALRRHHPHAHGDFWRSATFGPVRDANFEAPTVMATAKNIRRAACRARMTQTGRPRDYRKQHVVNLALAFGQGSRPSDQAATRKTSSWTLPACSTSGRQDCRSKARDMVLRGKSKWRCDGCRLKCSAQHCCT